MKWIYKCKICGGFLDAGERCDCQEENESQVEKAITGIIEKPDGKKEPAVTKNKVVKVKHMSYGELLHYADGTKKYVNFGD